MLYDSEHGDLNIALLGDVMPMRRLAVYREERYLKLRELLVRADATKNFCGKPRRKPPPRIFWWARSRAHFSKCSCA